MEIKGTFNPRFNGDDVIAFVSRKELELNNDYADYSTMQTWFEEDWDKRNIGIVKPWGQQSVVSKAFYMDLFDNLAVLKVNGDDGGFEYDYEITTYNRILTTSDHSGYTKPENLGVQGSVFPISLNTKLKPGHIIGISMHEGMQLIVDDEFAITKDKGGGWKHWVKLTTNNKEATYEPSLLERNVEYVIISHVIFGEYGTNYANVRSITTGEKMRCRFTLGDATGVEAMVTGKADRKSFNGVGNTTQDFVKNLQDEARELGEFTLISSLSNITPDGYVKDKSAMHIGHTLRHLVHREHHRLVSQKLVFQKGGTVDHKNGPVLLNEGLYHQMQRAYTIQYGSPGGITRAHLQEASDYIFRNNPMPVNERVIHFEGGRFAIDNIYELFKDEVQAQMSLIAPLLGAERVIPRSPVTGDLKNLRLETVAFRDVEIHGIGRVTVTEEPSLNYIATTGDRSTRIGMPGGYSHTAYSLIVRDVTNAKYSNNSVMPKGVDMRHAEASYGGNNEFIVTPEGPMTYYGQEQGRYSLTGKDVVSSSKYQMESYWIYSICATWIKDLSKIIIIELDKKAQKQFSY